MKRITSLAIMLFLVGMIVAGCGYPASINIKDLSMNGGQLTSVTLTREGKTGTTYILSGKSTSAKGGQSKVAFALDTEKGKEKVEAVFDVPEGNGVAFTQKVTPKGKIKSITVVTFAYKPYEFTAKDYP